MLSCLSHLRRKFLMALIALAISYPAAAVEPKRIVSLGGGITEILYRLNLGENIVGVDATSVYPPEALATKPNVGYVRTLGAEGIISLKPDIILADAIAGPADTLALIEQTGVKIVHVPEGLKPEDIRRRIEVVAGAVGYRDRGEALLHELDANLQKIAEAKSRHPGGKKVLFVLSMSNGRVTVGGKGTNIDNLLTFIGASNAAGSVQGWKPLSEEGIIASAPDSIIIMGQGHGPGGIPDDIFSLPAFAATPAAKTKSLVRVDGPYLLNYGPRTPLAALELLAALHDGGVSPPVKQP